MTDSFLFFLFFFFIPCALWSAALVLIVLAVRSHRVYVDISVQPMSFFTELRHYCCPPNGFHMKRNCSKPSQWQRRRVEVAGFRPALLSGCLFTLALICSNNAEFLLTKQLCHLAWSGQLVCVNLSGVILPQRKTLLTDHLLLSRTICPVTFTYSLPKPIKHLMCLLSSLGQ